MDCPPFSLVSTRTTPGRRRSQSRSSASDSSVEPSSTATTSSCPAGKAWASTEAMKAGRYVETL